MNILDKIVANKLREIKTAKKKNLIDTVGDIFAKDNSFLKAMENSRTGDIALIGEIKLASPSAGKLGSKGDVVKKAKEYENSGCEAISVVTDKKYFNGDLNFIQEIKQNSNLPVLVKDFILDQFQVYQMKQAGADAILLIVKIVKSEDLNKLVNLSIKMSIEPVVEVNNKKELKVALSTKAKLIAVNSRDLNNFSINIKKAANLGKLIPKNKTFLAFSGVKDRAEVNIYKKAGAKAILVGTSLMKTANPRELIKNLKGVQKVKVKICGIKSYKDAARAIEAGADFLGFIFIPSSKRFIDPKDAKDIIKRIIGRVRIVGVFQNQSLEYVNYISTSLNLDYVQLHGDENPDYCYKINKKVIKVFEINHQENIKKYEELMKQYKTDYLMIDRPKNKKAKPFNILDVKKLQETISIPIFLAGGLNPQNIKLILKNCQPFALDVSSGVEENGEKSLDKISEFIKNAKGGAR